MFKISTLLLHEESKTVHVARGPRGGALSKAEAPCWESGPWTGLGSCPCPCAGPRPRRWTSCLPDCALSPDIFHAVSEYSRCLLNVCHFSLSLSKTNEIYSITIYAQGDPAARVKSAKLNGKITNFILEV